MLLVIVQFMAAITSSIFACSPVPGFWHPEDTSRRCVDQRLVQTTHATINAAMDVLMLVLSAYFARQTGFYQEFGRFMQLGFVLGIIGIIAAFLRTPAVFVRTQPMKNPK